MDFKEISSKLSLYFLEELASSIKGLPNYGNVSTGLSRSGQPNELGFDHLNKIGIDILIKLDRDSEYSLKKEKELFKGTVVYKPLTATTMTKEGGFKIATIIDGYLNSGKRVHVHCKYGKDRTGLVIGLYKIKYKKATLSTLQRDWKKYGNPLGRVTKLLKNILNK